MASADNNEQNPETLPVKPESKSQVKWTASEFIAHDKSPLWYLILLGVSLLTTAAVFVITRDVVSAGVVIIAGLVLAAYASHKPRELEYTVDSRGIKIGAKYHDYGEFRSFSVATEGAFSSLIFMPLKRFAVPLTIYYSPGDEDKILDILSNQLPFEEHRMDAIENLMRRIRF